MAKAQMAGGSEEIGPGELLERRQRGRQALILSLLMLAGGVTGLVLSLTEADGAGALQGAIPAGVAIGLAALWLVSVIGGSIWYKRHIDELELAAQLWGIACAGAVVLILYPAWYLLWRGALAPEPNGHVMFGTLYIVMIIAYLWKKFR
ncbi:MAG TPA: hypothetical protein VLK25_14335 [Allosphingosinicella sp.]|nr:hypothetical protein [Allosphingosinicella sp.]